MKGMQCSSSKNKPVTLILLGMIPFLKLHKLLCSGQNAILPLKGAKSHGFPYTQ
jgi:hypothetical protein